MSKNRRRPRKKPLRTERRIRVRSIRRSPPDLRRLSRTLIELAMAEAEAAAEADHAADANSDKPPLPSVIIEDRANERRQTEGDGS